MWLGLSLGTSTLYHCCLATTQRLARYSTGPRKKCLSMHRYSSLLIHCRFCSIDCVPEYLLYPLEIFSFKYSYLAQGSIPFPYFFFWQPCLELDTSLP